MNNVYTNIDDVGFIGEALTGKFNVERENFDESLDIQQFVSFSLSNFYAIRIYL